MNQPKKGANQTKFLKVIIYPLSVNQRYRGFVSAVKFLPGARIKTQPTHLQVEIDGFSLTGQTFNLVFVIFSGLAPQNLKEDDYRNIRLESTAADIVVGLHAPDAEPELYPYVQFAKTTSLGILEGIQDNLATVGAAVPLFIINLVDSDDEGQKALAFTTASHVCTAPAVFKMEHLFHCLQLMNMSLNQEKVEKYTNLSKVPPPYGGWFNDQFAPPPAFGIKDLKVLFCGAAGVGKKATISQFANKAMSDNVGASTNKSISLVGGGSFPVTMTFSAATPPPPDALNGIDACVVMYTASLANVEETINAVKARGANCVLCCNKRDEATGDPPTDGMQLAKRLGCLFLESSAKDYDRVAQIFTLLLLTTTGGKAKGGAKPAGGVTSGGGKGKGGGGRGCTLF